MTDADAGLPVDALRADFDAALDGGNVVVTAATGSGKSTRLPVWAARKGRVLVVEPRRIATTSLAEFVAEQLGGAPGGRVGYVIRFDSRFGPDSDIVFVTPGIALRWYADDGLRRFSTVVLDELHERRWDTDLLLAMLRGDGRHRLVLTSATIAGERLARYAHARHLEAEGRSYPVRVTYTEREPTAMPSSRDLAVRVGDAVRRALSESGGDVLAFLPGRGEIRDAAARLSDLDADVIALHASAPAADQRRALRPGDRRRVILATNVAETSLTVPGVTAVVDSGLERRTGRRNGRTVLALQAVAQSGADQRSGRAGRTAPGLCIRLWGEHAPLQEVTPPEIQREDLSDLVLAAACAGRPARALAFPDPLPEAALARAEEMLTDIGAVDAGGLATERGRRLFALPVDTLLAHLVVAMPDAAAGAFMADLIAALSARQRLVRVSSDPGERDRLAAALGRRCDATLLVAALRGEDLPGVEVVRGARDEARRLAGQIRELAGLDAGDRSAGADPAGVMRAAMTAFPAMVFVRREKRRHALGNGDREVLVGDGSLLGADDEAALVFDDHSVPGRGTRETLTIATCLAPVALSGLVECGLAEPELAEPTRQDGRLVTRRRWRYAGRVVGEDETEPEGPAARGALADMILAGDLLAPAGERLRDDVAAWELYVRLGYADGEVPEAREWLVNRLQGLGVETATDVELIEPEDLRFDGVPEWERERFDRAWPREVSLTDLRMRIHYDLRRRIVTAEHVSGRRKYAPQRWELPAWPGWRVQFRRASRIVDVK